MAIIKITELPAATSPVSPSDVLPVVQGGVTKKTAINELGFASAQPNTVTRTIQNKLRETLSVKDFGAVGDGVADDTAAIQAALNAAKNSSALLFPAGVYRITSTLVIAAFGENNLSLYGDSWRSIILMATDNTPIFKIAGSSVTIRDMSLRYLNIQPATNTDAIAIAPDYMWQCYFENLFCYGAYAFVYVRPIPTTYYGNSNLYFSCSFRDIYILAYTGYGFYGNGWNGGVTGNVYSNIYINGQTPDRAGPAGTATAAISLGSQDDSIFDQVNIEKTNLTHAIKIDGISSAIVFNSLHIEECGFTDDILWLRNAYGITFNGILLRGTKLNANNRALMYVESNVRIFVNGVYENNTTTNGNTLYRYRSGTIFSGSKIQTTSVTAITAGLMVADNLTLKSVLFENIDRIASPQYQLDIGERTDSTQKTVRVNGDFVFDGLYAGTVSNGRNAQIEMVTNTDSTNCDSWKAYCTKLTGISDYTLAYSGISASYAALSYTDKFVFENAGPFRPASDNTQSLGTGSFRWSVVYAGTPTINTSDERAKEDISELSDAEKRVATALKKLVKKFKFKDSVAVKGNAARIHVGVIAQDVIAAFQAEGLDAMQYGIVCYDKWDDYLNEDGSIRYEAGDRYGIRYEELLAFIISAI